MRIDIKSQVKAKLIAQGAIADDEPFTVVAAIPERGTPIPPPPGMSVAAWRALPRRFVGDYR